MASLVRTLVVPVPTVARFHFLSPKLWYKILPALVAYTDYQVKKAQEEENF